MLGKRAKQVVGPRQEFFSEWRTLFRDEDLCAAAAGLVKKTYMWLKRLSITPKIMCTIPMTTDIFIL